MTKVASANTKTSWVNPGLLGQVKSMKQRLCLMNPPLHNHLLSITEYMQALYIFLINFDWSKQMLINWIKLKAYNVGPLDSSNPTTLPVISAGGCFGSADEAMESRNWQPSLQLEPAAKGQKLAGLSAWVCALRMVVQELHIGLWVWWAQPHRRWTWMRYGKADEEGLAFYL